MKHAQKSGVGTASLQLPGGVFAAALVGVNAFGDVVENGRILAGTQKNGIHINTAQHLLEHKAVSYTHLDVYKRQRIFRTKRRTIM